MFGRQRGGSDRAEIRDMVAKNGPVKEEEPKAETMLTEEEERELAELMGDD